jgi:glucosamine-6-phosphate deaminase
VVAAEWTTRLSLKPQLRMCLPAGETPAPLYREVSLRADFSQATVFLLDEFGLPADDPARCNSMLQRDLLDLLDRPPAAFDALDPEAEDIDAECDRFEMALAAGGLDLTLLGLGNNGHVGLNEPSCGPDCPTRKVNLSPETAAEMGRYGAAGSTTWGVTVGLGRLLQSEEIWLLVTGSRKTEILQRTLQGPIGPEVPSSYLRTAPNVVVWADESAAADL